MTLTVEDLAPIKAKVSQTWFKKWAGDSGALWSIGDQGWSIITNGCSLWVLGPLDTAQAQASMLAHPPQFSVSERHDDPLRLTEQVCPTGGEWASTSRHAVVIPSTSYRRSKVMTAVYPTASNGQAAWVDHAEIPPGMDHDAHLWVWHGANKPVVIRARGEGVESRLSGIIMPFAVRPMDDLVRALARPLAVEEGVGLA